MTGSPDDSRSAVAARPPARLAVTRLALTDFRCYTALRLEIGPEPVVLFGPNGAGKTNLLEAVSLLVPGRGLRRSKLAELGRREWGRNESNQGEAGQGEAGHGEAGDSPGRPWAVAASLLTPDGAVEVGTGLGAGERRVVRIDGETARGQAALAQVARAVWLTPAMDRLFLEGAGNRRRFLDRLVYGLRPGHAGDLAAFEHAARERARLLREGRFDPAWLGALEETMADKGVAVALARAEVAAELTRASAAQTCGFPAAQVALEGGLDSWLAEAGAVAAQGRLREALARSRRRDAETGGAAEGPHRSDLVVRHAARDLAAAQCSTGEQKALLIAIVLANARLQGAANGAAPLLLLDEVAAHLDETRRNALFDEILALGAQAWMTGTDRVLFDGLRSRAQCFKVADAALSAA